MLSLFSKFKHLLMGILLVPCFLIAGLSRADASHAANMELFYRHISGTTYEFTLMYYQNCLGSVSTPPGSIQLLASSASLGFVNRAAGTLLPVAGSVHQPANLYNCTVMTLCYQEHTFRGTVDLSTINPLNPQANDWVFSFELCCLPGGTINPRNIAAGTNRAECGLNNLDFPAGNDSPLWNEPFPPAGSGRDTVIRYPIVSICENIPTVIDQRVKEYNGDSLHHEFIAAMDAGGVQAMYVTGYSPAVPLPYQTPPGFIINPHTGQIPVKATLSGSASPGNYVVAMKVTEYRLDGGVMKPIGYIVRHINVFIESQASCPGNDIELTTKNVTLTCADTGLTVTVSRKFQCESADTDASFVKLTDQTGTTTYPVKDVSAVDCWNNSIATKFKVSLNGPLSAGNYLMTLKNGTDGNVIVSECGIEILPDVDTIFITVDSTGPAQILRSKDSLGTTLPYIAAECGQNYLEVAMSEKVKCSSIDPSGSDFLVVDSTGSVPIGSPAVISAAPGLCKDGLTQVVVVNLAAGLNPGKYGIYLKQGSDGNTLLNNCGEASAATPAGVKVNVSDVQVDLGPDLWYCKDSSFQALLSAPVGYTYQWSTGEVVRQIIVNTKGMYIVVIENNFGCQDIDTVVVTEVICTIGIEEAKDVSLEVYPNPTSGKLYVRNTGKDRDLDIRISDLNGKEIYRFVKSMPSQAITEIDLTNQATGVYFLQISEGKNVVLARRIMVD